MLEFVFRVMAWYEIREQDVKTWYESREQDRGASAVEYALILAAIVAVVAVTVFAIGGRVKGFFTGACTRLGETAANCGV
ncbi:hypothetical protein ACFY3U_27540 [Micromonospora sp. NPDC000089]|uniref:hypothetical protein n=1 Tax=unclassified Micromonospora TaxID=2617518 RepID=UPI0036A39C0B